MIERAIAERLPSGAITASSIAGSAQQRTAQRLQAVGLDPVVVGEQDTHLHLMLTGRAADDSSADAITATTASGSCVSWRQETRITR